MGKTELLNRCAANGEERTMLARVLDRMEQCQTRNYPTWTQMLSPGERRAVEDLLAAVGGVRHCFSGGFEGAERSLCVFLPDWQEGETLIADPDGPLAAVEGRFAHGAKAPGHRDVLGALMGLGLTREKIGDILIDDACCQVVTLRETLPILLSQWESAGRTKLSLREIALADLVAVVPEVKTIRDTVSSLRLDAIVGSAFSLSRGKAGDLVAAGRVTINHRECTKGDKPVAAGDVLACRGLGKCIVREVGGQSKKGRTIVVLERYI